MQELMAGLLLWTGSLLLRLQPRTTEKAPQPPQWTTLRKRLQLGEAGDWTTLLQDLHTDIFEEIAQQACTALRGHGQGAR